MKLTLGYSLIVMSVSFYAYSLCVNKYGDMIVSSESDPWTFSHLSWRSFRQWLTARSRSLLLQRSSISDVTGFVDPPLALTEMFSKINKLGEEAYENETRWKWNLSKRFSRNIYSYTVYTLTQVKKDKDFQFLETWELENLRK